MPRRQGMATWYRGVLYRSRLEARWGVFFHELSIAAEWEPQGFKCMDGTPYLPDFVLFPALGAVWAEVKPSWDVDPDEIAKWRKFSAIRPGPASRSVLLIGPPAVHMNPVVFTDEFSEDDTSQEWRPCPSGHHFDIAYPGAFGTKLAEDGCDQLFGWDGEAKIAAAVSAALSERFDPRDHRPGAAA